MTRTLASKIILSLVFASSPTLLLFARDNQDQSKAKPDGPKADAAKLAGTWKGECQDGRTFVIVVLNASGNDITGSVSIGEMHGDDEGACMLVKAPPVPVHAQTISQASADQSVLSFRGSARPDGSYTKFEFRQTEQNKAELKLLGTPVEKHPWHLARVE